MIKLVKKDNVSRTIVPMRLMKSGETGIIVKSPDNMYNSLPVMMLYDFKICVQLSSKDGNYWSMANKIDDIEVELCNFKLVEEDE